MDSPIRIHVDTDIGGDIDDLCALAMLLRWPGVEITGITTVAEHDGKRAGYARRALALAGREEILVAAGADVQLGNLRLGAELPTEAAYWPEPVPASPGPLEAALDLLEQSVASGAIIVGIGPYTNLSFLEQRNPGTLANAKLFLMGWSVRPSVDGLPNWTSEWDYNVQADPVAAENVFEASTATLIPLEMTAQTALRRSHLATLDEGDPLARLIARQARAFAEEWRNDERYRDSAGIPPDFINFQHDALACAVAVGWDGAVIQDVRLAAEVTDDWLCARETDAGRRHRLVTAIDAERFNALWLDLVSRQGLLTGTQVRPR